ncbi:MAG: hypothetical protein LAO31_18540 [Acidobacteriia bacterium]|nr:hypothetical protein [Terriglobia bacterium]
MSTTTLFVELVVIGLHSILWIGILVLTFVGYQNLAWEKLLTLNLAVPVLGITYVLGIVIDRLSDLAFISQDHRLRKMHPLEHLPPFLMMRFFILNKSKDTYEQLEYTRSRLRIARAAILNFAMMTLAAILFVWAHQSATPARTHRLLASLVIVVVGTLLTYFSYESWVALTKTYTSSVIAAYQVLQDEENKK